MGPPGGGNKQPPPNFNPPQNQYPSNPRTTFTDPREEAPPSVRPRPRQPQPQPQGNLGPEGFIPRPQTTTASGNVPSQFPSQPAYDEPDGRPGHSVNVNVSYQQDEVTNSTPNIFTSFIVNRMDNDGFDVPRDLRCRQLQDNEKEVAQVLQRIGDDMSNNHQLNHLISSMRVTPETAYKTFSSVAAEIFSDGTINWGRICTLFYFAYKLAIQVLDQLPLIDMIIAWVSKFVFQKLAKWIWDRGGWRAAHEYFGATSGQLVVVFLAGVAISSLFWYMKK